MKTCLMLESENGPGLAPAPVGVAVGVARGAGEELAAGEFVPVGAAVGLAEEDAGGVVADAGGVVADEDGVAADAGGVVDEPAGAVGARPTGAGPKLVVALPPQAYKSAAAERHAKNRRARRSTGCLLGPKRSQIENALGKRGETHRARDCDRIFSRPDEGCRLSRLKVGSGDRAATGWGGVADGDRHRAIDVETAAAFVRVADVVGGLAE